MKPALSLVGTASFPHDFAKSTPSRRVSSDVVTHRMTSTSFITCAGLKKCRPTKRSGREVAAAWAITGSEERGARGGGAGAGGGGGGGGGWVCWCGGAPPPRPPPPAPLPHPELCVE